MGRDRPERGAARRARPPARGAARRRRPRRDLDGRSAPVGGARSGDADRDTLLFADCVTSLGGIPLAFDDWGVDFAYSCTQKALGAPPGMSPIAFSPRALERARERTGSVPFSFDIELLMDYWIKASDHLPPHGADPAHLRALPGAPACARRGPRGALGAPRGGRAIPAAAGPRPRVRPARGPGPPATPPDRCARARRRRRPGRAATPARRARHRGRRRAGPDAPAMWRIGLMGRTRRSLSPIAYWRRSTPCWPTSARPPAPADRRRELAWLVARCLREFIGSCSPV